MKRSTCIPIFLLCITIFFTIVCTAQNPTTIEIQSNYAKNITVKLSTLVSGLNYVPLETSAESIVGRILKTEVKGDFIFIWTVDKQILTFNVTTGKFFGKVNSVGKGPQEYTNIVDFDVDRETKTIYLADRRAIVGFSYDGKFKNSIPVSDPFMNMAVVGKDRFAYFIDAKRADGPNLKVVNEKGKVINEYSTESNRRWSWPNSPFVVPGHFFEFDHTVYFKNPFEKTYFSVGDEKLMPHLTFQLGALLMPAEIFADSKTYDSQYNRYIFMGNVLENKNYIFVRYSYGETKSNLLYDKAAAKVIANNHKSSQAMTNDLDGMKFWPAYLDGQRAVNLIEALEFKEQAGKLKASTLTGNGKLKEVFSKVAIDDNPVLQIVTLK